MTPIVQQLTCIGEDVQGDIIYIIILYSKIRKHNCKSRKVDSSLFMQMLLGSTHGLWMHAFLCVVCTSPKDLVNSTPEN